MSNISKYGISKFFSVFSLSIVLSTGSANIQAGVSDQPAPAKLMVNQANEMPTLLEKIGLRATRPATSAELTKLKIKSGLVLETVDGISDVSGVQPGDVLISINGREAKFGNVKNLPDDFPSTIILLVARGDERIPIAVQIPPRNRYIR